MQNDYLIIWDWDNTLANTRPAVRAGLEDVAQFYGLPAITDSDVLNVMTSHRGVFWQRYFGANVPEAIAYYVKCYRKHTDLVKLFPETVNILTYVKELKQPQIVLSNKYEEALIEEVAHQGVISYFNAIRGTIGPLGKPDKSFVSDLLERFEPRNIILIGDGISDMLMAQNIGATSILVHQPDKTLPHNYDCETLSDVLKKLNILL